MEVKMISKSILHGYRKRDGCWNCKNVNRAAVANDAYPQCIALNRFVAHSGICDLYKKDPTIWESWGNDGI